MAGTKKYPMTITTKCNNCGAALQVYVPFRPNYKKPYYCDNDGFCRKEFWDKSHPNNFNKDGNPRKPRPKKKKTNIELWGKQDGQAPAKIDLGRFPNMKPRYQKPRKKGGPKDKRTPRDIEYWAAYRRAILGPLCSQVV